MAKKPTYEELQQRVKELEKEAVGHKKIEEPLRESEERYRLLLESITDGIQVTDSEMRYVLVNDKLAHMAQMPKETLLGSKMTDLFPGVEETVFFKTYKQVMETCEPTTTSDQFTFPDGRKAWYEVHVYPAQEGLFVIVTDITERKQAQVALRESEAQKKAILDASIDRIRLVDKDLRILWANKTTTRELNVSSEDLVGKFCYQVFAGRDTPCPECPTKKAFISGNVEHTVLHQPHFQDIEGESYWDAYATPVTNESGDVENVIQFARNMTEKMLREQALRESEEKYRSLVDSTDDSIYLLDRNCTYLFINKKHLSRLGLGRKKAKGRTYAEFHTEDDTKELIEKVEKLFETGKSLVYEYRSKREGRYFLRTLSPVKEPDGKTISVTVVSKDITERKQLEQVLQESEEKYRTLFEQSRDAIYITKREGELVDVNQSFLDLFDYTREEITEMKAQEVYIDPDDRSKFKKQVEQKGSVKDFEEKLRKKDGAEMDCLITATVRRANDGSILGYQGIVRDITKQKLAEKALRESEEKWRSLAETAPCIILTVQRDGTIQFLNRPVGNYTPEDTIGTKVWDYVPPDHHSIMQKAIEHVFQTGHPISYQILGVGPEGPASAWYITQLGPILKDGKVVAVTMAATDITEMKKVHEALRESEEKYRTLFENANDAIFLADTKTNIILDANRQAEQLIGRPREEIIGMHQAQLLSPQHADYYKDKFRRHLEAGYTFDLETEVITKDRRVVPVLISASVIRLRGKEVIMGLFRDISKEKRILDLTEEIATKKVIEKAKGILMDRHEIGEKEAMRRLQKESRRQRRKIKEIAQAVISSELMLN
jgi:PAS domain S-box-containing protein